MLSFLSALLLSIPALASDFCAPLPSFRGEIRFCADNRFHIPPATECHDRYRALVESKSKEVRGVLLGHAANAASAQHSEFGGSVSIYSSAEATLNELIHQGEGVLSELDAYSRDFVPAYGSRPARRIKAHKKKPKHTLKNFNCWQEPMNLLESVKADVQTVLDQLIATRTQAAALHGDTSGRDENLAEAEDNSGGKTKKENLAAKKNARIASTVTGQLNKGNLIGKISGASEARRSKEWMAGKDSAGYLPSSPSMASARRWPANSTPARFANRASPSPAQEDSQALARSFGSDLPRPPGMLPQYSADSFPKNKSSASEAGFAAASLQAQNAEQKTADLISPIGSLVVDLFSQNKAGTTAQETAKSASTGALDDPSLFTRVHNTLTRKSIFF